MSAGMPLIWWIVGAAMCGRMKEEARAALEANASLAKSFPAPDQAESIEGYRQVGPC